jgi:flagellar biosynthesis protein FlhF
MHLKRFRGETVRDALARVRAELGPEALVLSTQLVPASGWRGFLGGREVEVTAATDRDVSEPRPQRQEVRQPEPEALTSSLAARLEAAGFGAAVAKDVKPARGFKGRRSASAEAIRWAVTEWAAPYVATDEAYSAVEVFLGPPGAGKTTTVAKIAAQERARRGARLRLVSADGFRVGAVEQLRLYADIIGAPFVAARTPGDLDRALIEATGTVLVDTAGRSPRDGAAHAVLAVLRGARGVRTHLVVPAGSSAREVSRLIALHSESNVDRIVLTKVDEAESAGAMASVLRDSGLKVSYLGTGQRVPDDLVRATPTHLASALLGDGRAESAA